MKVYNRNVSFNDEGSISSTFTVDALKKRSPLRASKSLRVGFDLTKNSEYDSPPLSNDEVSERWFSASNYKRFKRGFIEVGRAFQRVDYENPDPQSFNALLTSIFLACFDGQGDTPDSCPVPKRDRMLLKKWFDRGSRRGLERVCVYEIFADKASRRKRVTEAVLAAQEHAKTMSKDEGDECLKLSSEMLSRPSCHFAWFLAM